MGQNRRKKGGFLGCLLTYNIVDDSLIKSWLFNNDMRLCVYGGLAVSTILNTSSGFLYDFLVSSKLELTGYKAKLCHEQTPLAALL